MVIQLGGNSGLPYVGRLGSSLIFWTKWKLQVALEVGYHQGRFLTAAYWCDCRTSACETTQIKTYRKIIINSYREEIATSDYHLSESRPRRSNYIREGHSCHHNIPHCSLKPVNIPEKSTLPSNLPSPTDSFATYHSSHQHRFLVFLFHAKTSARRTYKEISLYAELLSLLLSHLFRLPHNFHHLGKVGKRTTKTTTTTSSCLSQRKGTVKSATLVCSKRSSDLPAYNHNGLIWNGLAAQNALRNTF